jgi:hypothetical protein
MNIALKIGPRFIVPCFLVCTSCLMAKATFGRMTPLGRVDTIGQMTSIGRVDTIGQVTLIGKVDTIGMGHTPLLTGALHPGLRQYLIYMQDPKEPKNLFFWFWLRNIAVQTVNGEKVFVISQHWYGSDSSTYREVNSINRMDDFYPVYHCEATVGKTRAYNWGSDKIKGADTVAGNSAKDFALAFTAPNFNWNLDVETFEMLPLAKGKTFAINFYDAGLDTPQYVIYKVAGDEVLQMMDNQQIDCWKLVTEGNVKTTGNKIAHYSETYWISKQGHEFLKEEDHYGRAFRLKIRMPAAAPDLLKKFEVS